MLTITIPQREYFIEETSQIVTIKETTLRLEHSLLSVSKWESKHCKPLMSKFYEKTSEEAIDYIRCMTIDNNVDPMVYMGITQDQLDEIYKYMEAPMTGTKFSEDANEKPSREVITAEILYWQMITLGIPFECQKWHLNRLLTLIKVCSRKNAPKKKIPRREALQQRRELNNKRKKKLNTRG